MATTPSSPSKKIALSKSGLAALSGAMAGNVASQMIQFAWGKSQSGETHVPVVLEPIVLSSEAIDSIPQSLIHDVAPVAETTSNDQSFDDAFAAARAELGPGGVFEWRGQVYGTYFKEEWEAMDDNQQQAYWSSIEHEASTYSLDPVAPVETADAVMDAPIGGDDQPDAPVTDSSASSVLAAANEPAPMTDTAIPVDMDGDGVYEAEGVDADGDGFFDAVLFDVNQNDVPEVVMLDTNQNGLLDAMMADLDENGEMDQAGPMPQEIQLPVPDAAEPVEAASLDDSPDFDNDADMSEWT